MLKKFTTSAPIILTLILALTTKQATPEDLNNPNKEVTQLKQSCYGNCKTCPSSDPNYCYTCYSFYYPYNGNCYYCNNCYSSQYCSSNGCTYCDPGYNSRYSYSRYGIYECVKEDNAWLGIIAIFIIAAIVIIIISCVCCCKKKPANGTTQYNNNAFGGDVGVTATNPFGGDGYQPAPVGYQPGQQQQPQGESPF